MLKWDGYANWVADGKIQTGLYLKIFTHLLFYLGIIVDLYVL